MIKITPLIFCLLSVFFALHSAAIAAGANDTPGTACAGSPSNIDTSQPAGSVVLGISLGANLTGLVPGDTIEIYEYRYPIGYQFDCVTPTSAVYTSTEHCNLPVAGGTGKFIASYTLRAGDLNGGMLYCKYNPPRDGTNPWSLANLNTDLTKSGNLIAGRFRLNVVGHSAVTGQFSVLSNANSGSNNSIEMLVAAPPTPSFNASILVGDGSGKAERSCTLSTTDVNLYASPVTQNAGGSVYPFIITQVSNWTQVNGFATTPASMPGAPNNVSNPYYAATSVTFNNTGTVTTPVTGAHLQDNTAFTIAYTVTDELATSSDVSSVQQLGAGSGSVPAFYTRANSPVVSVPVRHAPDGPATISPLYGPTRTSTINFGGTITMGCPLATTLKNAGANLYYSYDLKNPSGNDLNGGVPNGLLSPYLTNLNASWSDASTTDTVTVPFSSTVTCDGIGDGSNATNGWLGPAATINSLTACLNDTQNGGSPNGIDDGATVTVTQTVSAGATFAGSSSINNNLPMTTTFSLTPAIATTLSANNVYLWGNPIWQNDTRTAATLLSGITNPFRMNFGTQQALNTLPQDYMQFTSALPPEKFGIISGSSGLWDCTTSTYLYNDICTTTFANGYQIPAAVSAQSSVTVQMQTTTGSNFNDTPGPNTFAPSGPDYVVNTPNSFKIVYDGTMPTACPNSCPNGGTVPVSEVAEIEPAAGGSNPMDNFLTTLGSGAPGPLGIPVYQQIPNPSSFYPVSFPISLNLYLIARCTPTNIGSNICAVGGSSVSVSLQPLAYVTNASGSQLVSATPFNISLTTDPTASTHLFTWTGNGLAPPAGVGDQILEVFNTNNAVYVQGSTIQYYFHTNITGSPNATTGYDVDQAILQLCGCN